ncbi:MAG: hypothetical protein D6797_06385, partial [Bdellovibrio sp.]
MKIWVSDYSLTFKDLKASRKGFLIKVEESDEGGVGYSDCFPWPEFGHDPVEQQKERLRKGDLSSLLERSLSWAQKDARLRKEGKSAFVSDISFSNHFLVPDILTMDFQQGPIRNFSVLKIKMGNSLARETECLRG